MYEYTCCTKCNIHVKPQLFCSNCMPYEYVNPCFFRRRWCRLSLSASMQPAIDFSMASSKRYREQHPVRCLLYAYMHIIRYFGYVYIERYEIVFCILLYEYEYACMEEARELESLTVLLSQRYRSTRRTFFFFIAGRTSVQQRYKWNALSRNSSPYYCCTRFMFPPGFRVCYIPGTGTRYRLARGEIKNHLTIKALRSNKRICIRSTNVATLNAHRNRQLLSALRVRVRGTV